MIEAARVAGIAIPDLKEVVKEIAADMAERPERGKVASYIPELAKVDPKKFGIVVVGNDGEVASAGDSDIPFSIQSISKVFTLTLALGKIGDPRSAEALIQSLQDEDWLVRRNAAESLARLGAKQAIEPLLPLLEDENTMVQETVEGVLASLGWKQATSS